MSASRRRFLQVLFAGAIFAAVVTGGWYAHRARDLREEDLRIRAELETNQRLMAALRRARTGVTAGRAEASQQPPAPAEMPVRPPVRTAPANNARSLMESLHARPEYVRFLQLDRRRATWRLYGDLFGQLKMSPERLAQFKRLLDEAGQSDHDVREAAAQMGIGPGEPAHARVLSATGAENEAKIRAFLQPEELALYQTFKNAQGWRLIYGPEFRDFAAERGVPPLGAEQRQALTVAFGRAQEWSAGAAEAKLPATEAHRQLTARFAELAGESLLPAQRAALAEYLEFTHRRGELLARLAYPDRPPGSVIVTVSSGP